MDCEPTYEELKLSVFQHTFNKLKDCEPTYEELKLLKNNLILLDNDTNCEPTYEELKLILFGGNCFASRLLRAYL